MFGRDALTVDDTDDLVEVATRRRRVSKRQTNGLLRVDNEDGTNLR